MPQNIGSQADPRVVDPTADATLTALLKGLLATLAAKSAATANQHEPAANTAAVVTKAAAGAGISNVLALVAWSYDADPTAGSLTIEDGSGTTVFKVDITTGGPGFFAFSPPLKGTANTALIATLAAGGGSVSGIVSLHTWTE
jgi:hypothetical protein